MSSQENKTETTIVKNVVDELEQGYEMFDKNNRNLLEAYQHFKRISDFL